VQRKPADAPSPAGEPALELFGDVGAAFVTPSAKVQPQRHPDADGSQGWLSVVAAIHRCAPIVGDNDYWGALRALEALSMSEMLQALHVVAQEGELEQFFAAVGATASLRAHTAFRVARLEKNIAGADRATLDELNRTLSSLSIGDQAEVVAHVAHTAGQSGNEILAEGVTAALQTATAPAVAATTAGPPPIGPGPWQPPGNQPIPFYIGNQAHDRIAARYMSVHRGQTVVDNTVPFSTILRRMAGARVAAVGPQELAMRPDITNLTLKHVYEIKPAAQVAEAQAKLSLYLGIFQTAGVPMSPGSQTEPGTSGVVEAPGGHYIYKCPLPGIILYQYCRGPYVPTPVPVAQEQPEPQTEPSGFWEYMRKVTGLTGAALVVYVLISEGTRVIPVRNFIPAP
jgi:hypothetical protein